MWFFKRPVKTKHNKYCGTDNPHFIGVCKKFYFMMVCGAA
jgi:hypothetical protein